MKTTTNTANLTVTISIGRKWASLEIIDNRPNGRSFFAWNLDIARVQHHADCLTEDFEVQGIPKRVFINGDDDLMAWVNAENDKVFEEGILNPGV